ncbi:MAG: Fur family transcriptional regulator [Candidatus Methylomirabilales bacterium]
MDVPGAARLTDEPALAEALRAAGLRVTRPRLLVLGFLREAGGHRSVEEIRAALGTRGVALPRASVYNVVTDLARGRLAMVTDVGPGRALYESSQRWHHHFVCRTCGAIADVPCVVGRRPCLTAGARVGEVEEAQVTFRGRCQACLLKAPRRPRRPRPARKPRA